MTNHSYKGCGQNRMIHFGFQCPQSYLRNDWSESRQILYAGRIYQMLALGSTDYSLMCMVVVMWFIFRSTLPQSWPNTAGLKCTSVCPSVRTCVRACIRRTCVRARAYVRPQSFFYFNDIWLVGRSQWVMHDGMQYDPFQGHRQVNEPFKIGNPAFFRISSAIYNGSWQLSADSWSRARYLNLIGPHFRYLT